MTLECAACMPASLYNAASGTCFALWLATWNRSMSSIADSIAMFTRPSSSTSRVIYCCRRCSVACRERSKNLR